MNQCQVYKESCFSSVKLNRIQKPIIGNTDKVRMQEKLGGFL